MKLGRWNKAIPKSRPNKYSQLLTILIIHFIVIPFTKGTIGAILISTVFLGIIVSIIRTFNLKKKFLFLLLALAGVSFALDIYADLQINFKSNYFLEVLVKTINCVFIFAALFTINRKIFSEKRVNRDTIKGGIAMFMFIGMFWALLYSIIYHFDPNAFSESVEADNLYDNMFYFSFTTLTTLGYGDITPVSEVARNLANLEAITGMLYPAIFIARLVGLYTTQEMTEKD